KGSKAPRNAALIPSVRTLADFKLGIDLYRGSASWNSIGIPSSKVFGTMVKKRLILFMIK
ncbi:hypothetical protein B296_00013250, partial [Ensete ventricosum]